MAIVPILKLISFTIVWIENGDVVRAQDFERLPRVIKSDQDVRAYRAIKLSNGMKVMLVSDPATETSAASLVVGVGAMSDSKEEPGIANLLRYLLPTASRRYPTKHEFNKKYLRERGGEIVESVPNNYEHETNFSFYVNPDFLEGALHRFSQFFIQPLFEDVDDKALEESLGSFSNLHDILMFTDDLRIATAEKLLSEKDHAYNNLAYGTVQILTKYAKLGSVSQHDELRNFYSNRYSANIMCLAVLGREKLSTLEKMVVSSFKDVEKKNNIESLFFSYEEHPWKKEQLGHKMYIVPLKNIRSLRLSFPTPDVLHQYRVSPQIYTANLLKHGGPGTLKSILLKNSLCYNVNPEYHSYAGVGFFRITFDLTEEGLKEVDLIIGLTFQYIRLLNKDAIQKWLYDEAEHLGKIQFKVKNPPPPVPYVQYLASSMHNFPVEDVLSFEFLRGPWDSEPIRDFLSYLRPDNMNVTIVDKSFENITMKIEPWYETKYGIEKIPAELIKEWKSPTNPLPELRIQTPNEFIPEHLHFTLAPVDENETDLPYLIQKSPTSQIWYQQNRTPVLMVAFEVFCPIVRLNVLNRSLIDIFVNMLNISLDEEYRYRAEEAGFTWTILPAEAGFQVEIRGYSEKFFIVVQKLISKISNFENEFNFNEENFEKAKENHYRALQDFERSENLFKHAFWYMTHLLTEDGIHASNILAGRAWLQFENMKKFVSKLPSRVFVQGFIYGNCDKHTAIDMANIIGRPFQSTRIPVLPQQISLLRTKELDEGSKLVYHVPSNNTEYYAYCAYFQFSSTSIHHYMKGFLFLEMIAPSCTKILLSKDGGHSLCKVHTIGDVHGLIISMQSKKSSSYMDSRLERFLNIIQVKLENISDTDFEVSKMMFVMKKTAEKPDFEKYFSQCWSEINNRLYVFDRSSQEINELYQLEKEDILAFFQENIAKSSPKRRKLTLHLFPKESTEYATEGDDDDSPFTKIEDITAFKSSVGFFSLPSTTTNLLPLGSRDSSH